MTQDRNLDIYKGMKNDRNQKYLDKYKLSLKTDYLKKKQRHNYQLILEK